MVYDQAHSARAHHRRSPDHLSGTFAALADPTRRAIVERLLAELAKPFLHEMSLPAITKHLKVLEKAGLITKTRDAQWRPCELNGERLKDVADWMEQYRTLREESFDRLEDYLRDLQTKEKKNGRKK